MVVLLQKDRRIDQESVEAVLSHGDKKALVEQEQGLQEVHFGLVVEWLLLL